MLRQRDSGCQGRVQSFIMAPMPKRSIWRRIPLLVLTLLQFSVPAAASWADARIGERTGPAHIESHSGDLCARVHPADCAFHRFLSAPIAGASATVARFRERDGIRWTPATRTHSFDAALARLHDSRAPPSLS